MDHKEAIKRVLQVFDHSGGDVRPHFFLTGPSGSSKTFTIETLCEELSIPLVTVNAAAITREGLAGNSLSKAIAPLAQYPNMPVVCFVDEFDKLFISGNSNDAAAHESTNGVQNEFLKVLESDLTQVFGDYGKYNNINVSRVLFVFAGAFNNEEDITLSRLQSMGVKTEFLGRVGLVFNTQKPSLEAMFNAMENSTVLADYADILPNVDVDKAKQEVKKAIEEVYPHNNLGYRVITSFIHQYYITGEIRHGGSSETPKKNTNKKPLEL